MKTATKHPDVLKSLAKKFAKQFDVPDRVAADPLQTLVRGIFSFDTSDNRANDAMKVIAEEFVDLNELRVATELEVVEMIGERYSRIEERVSMVIQCLNHIFEREHTLSLERLKTIPKREARQFLKDLPGVHPFAEAYVMLLAFDGNAFPIDDAMLELLVEEGVFEDGISLEESQKFIEGQMKEAELYNFYTGLRQAVSEKKRRSK
jgi:endonuclease III